jgi:hypothetical protein
MKTYEYHRIGKLEEQMGAAGVDQEITARIMEGEKASSVRPAPQKRRSGCGGRC